MSSLSERITLLKDLIARREAIDKQLETILGGETPTRTLRCSKCGSTSHTARTCSEAKESQHQDGMVK